LMVKVRLVSWKPLCGLQLAECLKSAASITMLAWPSWPTRLSHAALSSTHSK
jgi:hypothetical protein